MISVKAEKEHADSEHLGAELPAQTPETAPRTATPEKTVYYQLFRRKPRVHVETVRTGM